MLLIWAFIEDSMKKMGYRYATRFDTILSLNWIFLNSSSPQPRKLQIPLKLTPVQLSVENIALEAEFLSISRFFSPKLITARSKFILHRTIHSEKIQSHPGLHYEWCLQFQLIFNKQSKEQHGKPRYIKQARQQKTKPRQVAGQRNRSFSIRRCKTRKEIIEHGFIPVIHLSNVSETRNIAQHKK